MRSWTDEDDAGRNTRIGEIGILRQKAVARMNGIGTRFRGDADDLIDREISLYRTHALADLIGFIGLEAMKRELVLLGIDCDGANAKLGGGTEDTDGYLRTIGDQQTPEAIHAAAFNNAAAWARLVIAAQLWSPTSLRGAIHEPPTVATLASLR